MSDSSRPHGLQPTRLLCPRDFPGKSTGVGCHCLLLNVQRSLPKRARGLFSSLLLLSRFSCVRPHRWQPTRGPRPWDSPGKNTGVGCHFLLQCMKVKSESEVAQSCLTLNNPMDCSLPGSSVHGIFQVKVLEWAAIARILVMFNRFPVPTNCTFKWGWYNG